MKRESEKTKHTLDGQIYKHYGLFGWQECLFCKKEFRREDGYRFLAFQGQWSYSCESCSCSKSHCNENLGVMWENIRNNRPEAPPAPPPMRSYKNETI